MGRATSRGPRKPQAPAPLLACAGRLCEANASPAKPSVSSAQVDGSGTEPVEPGWVMLALNSRLRPGLAARKSGRIETFGSASAEYDAPLVPAPCASSTTSKIWSTSTSKTAFTCTSDGEPHGAGE